MAMTSATMAIASRTQGEERIASDRRERELAVVGAELRAQRLDDEFVVLALRQPRDGHRADHADAVDSDRKRAAVRRVFGKRQTVFLGERRARLLHAQADRVRAAAEVIDDARLAAHPVGVVGRGAGERAEEQRVAEGAHVNGDGMRARHGQLAQMSAELPGAIGVEAGKHQRALLRGHRLQIVGDIHRGRVRLRELSPDSSLAVWRAGCG
ncbi:hypothetical protein PT2222_340073 [Paraburkholderia tropica]